MSAKRIGALLVLAAIAGATVAFAARPQRAPRRTRVIVPAARPSYQVLSGQIANTGFGVVYVLNNEYRQLAILKYDAASNNLTPLAIRDLAKDFDIDVSTNCSMATIQLGDQSGLLYITDPGYHRALVYKVDLPGNQVTPQQPIDLRKLFDH